jgi:hypothetical protein
MPDKLPKGKSNNCKCQTCGREFYLRRWYLNNGGGRYCSRVCLIGTLEQRFWEKVEKRGPDDCWPWKATPNHDGYGLFKYNGKDLYAARVSYELRFGKMPASMETCHTCDVRYAKGDISYRLCVNPAHLIAGTHIQNIKDMHAKGRGVVLEPTRGVDNFQAKLTEESVLRMREMWNLGLATGKQLSDIFRVSRGNVSLIVNRKIWTHI